jgi:hypothetical protein
MNTQNLDRVVSQHAADLSQDAGRCRRPAPADRQQRDSIRTRAGWTLINVGLKLTDPPARSRPHPAGL